MLLVETYLAPSFIHGVGLFAARDIRKGEMVWVLDTRVDQLLTEAEIAVLDPIERAQVMRYAYFSNELQKYVLCADDGRFFNHSSTPNCIDKEIPQCNFTAAARDIAAGEEMTCDYVLLDGRYQPEEVAESLLMRLLNACFPRLAAKTRARRSISQSNKADRL